MFSKKLHVDVKKSTLKIQDVKKDSATRFKHLKIVLENFDIDEAKGFFEGNFSHVYFILHDCFVSAETNLRQRAHREELDQVLLLLEKILILLPELLNRRWQCHSLARILHKLLHPGNSWKLRRQALRFFILWYQALGDNAPQHIHQMFACLVPNFSSYQLSRSSEYRNKSNVSAEEDDKRDFFETQHSSAVFHCNSTQQGPVTQPSGTPILPIQSGEKPLDNETVRFFEALLEFMVTQVVKIEWRDKHTRQHKCFQFLLERFKASYLRQICPGFDDNFSLYKPNLELPTMRQPSTQNQNNYSLCKVALIKWLASFTHVSKKDKPFVNPSNVVTSVEENTESDGRRVSVSQSIDSNSWTSEIPFSQQDNHANDNQIAVVLVREVLYGSRDNVNFVHEIYRQAFLLDFTHAGAIRKAIAVYKDWIQMNEIPPFMLEPLDNLKDRENEDSKVNSFLENENDKSPSDNYRLTRLRNDSYLGAIHRENLFVRAGLQNVLQLFITQASNVFFLENIGGNASAALLEEQIDSCKRVLNVYRYVVMHARLESSTWDQLLRVLLQITSLVLGGKTRRKSHDGIGGKLAPAIFQTLIVTWIKANLNVVIAPQLWNQFLEVLTSLTRWKELIREWAKTLDTLTRVLARHVYNLDLNDLPLERISEQKSKKRRGIGYRVSASSVQSPRRGSIDRERDISYKENIPDNLSREFRKSKLLPRSSSDNNLYNSKNRGKPVTHHGDILPFEISGHTSRLQVTLSSSVEIDATQLVSHQNSANDQDIVGNKRKLLIGRRTKSLDCIIVPDCEPITPRCPSPTPSSGVDSNKDSPIQIENIDGNSIDANDVSEKRSVMAGGGVRGWLPDVAVVLWKRMLSALGDVNNIQDPILHGQVMDYLIQLSNTLVKIRSNQGVTNDNQATPSAPELIPPLTVISPWCFKATQLPMNYEIGKLAAYRLICILTTQPLDINLPKAHLILFYRALHFGIMSNDIKVIYAIVKHTGPRLFSLNLPGSSLLIMDYIHAANIILKNDDTDAPRIEAVSILGSLLSLPIVLEKLPVLKKNGSDIETTTCPEANELILEVLFRNCRHEPTGIARCIALSSIAMFAYRELCLQSQHPRVSEAITVLLQSLKANHPSVVQTACDSLGLLCDKADTLLLFYPEEPCKIIQVLAETLDNLNVREHRSSLITSMLFCLSEWAMHLDLEILTRDFQGKPLLLTIFTVLDNIIYNKSNKLLHDLHVYSSKHKNDEKEFNPNIILDNFGENNDANNKSFRSNIQAIQLAARVIVMHLVNHLGHFPMGIGAARLSSIIVELDDVLGINSDELSSAIFNAPNIQLLMLSSSTIISFIELTALNSPDVTSDFITAPSIARVLLRDLIGKASWDSSMLYNNFSDTENTDLEPMKNIEWLSLHYETNKEDSINILYPFRPIPCHVIRHREPYILPTFANTASDMDNLDDLLCYIGHTSPEVLTNPEITLNCPANPPQVNCMENETMITILNQRNAARDYVLNCNQHITTSEVTINPTSVITSAPFHHSRLLFSHLGLAGWEQRQKLHLLAKNEKLLRELRNLDGQRSRETHKMAIIYVGPGQEDKNSILGNTIGSTEYENFVARLAWEVELESHTGFLGGLTPGKASGISAPYFATSFSEILFHVATRMPLDSPESLLQKTRHLGNDEIHIVWSEHWRDYRRDIIPTEFCDVLIAIYPLPNKLYRIQISRKSEIPFFGPLFDECIVEDQVLPGLVRITALAASRAKRSTLSLYQQYYEERARSIDVVMRNYKESTTFEEFATNIYSPVLPKNAFRTGSSVTDSITTSVQSTASSNLAAALLDSHQGCSNNLRGSAALSGIDTRNHRVSDNTKVLQDSPDFHGISPRPSKKMSFKSIPKPRNNQHLTPPDSPNINKFKVSN
ncbi:ral GTPase-activating protein subunit alpha-1 isoform X3 [Cotesia glomerata]|uniref:ral GTPase-activating protein subunit alpha-1 isoform X3 n=1 Tax=Cotesia glomerata TaxID=32391 RepID=UPI001D035394|nr:ral GTPase-activating protein subunit alpha-1 isoform X3 [Cotesia glomerata]